MRFLRHWLGQHPTPTHKQGQRQWAIFSELMRVRARRTPIPGRWRMSSKLRGENVIPVSPSCAATFRTRRLGISASRRSRAFIRPPKLSTRVCARRPPYPTR